MAEQNEKAFQKYRPVFVHIRRDQSSRRKPVSGDPKRLRYWKDIGLGFRTPKTASCGTYVDRKCPFTSDVSIRGRILTGVVHSVRMKRTVIIRRNYLHYLRKYNRYEKRHRNLAAHCSPAFQPHVGDRVTIGECRPLCKTVRYNVIRIDSTKSKKKKAFKAF
eukprot:TRINITY_DN382_c0_g1_i1.p2 TRINITY_DN382_c0_g1~~TRINITY_DN382_c0_g1_i1.p2  ORF type:complete len:173 (+),score=50.83 TRINITY_DN382_c0_g1_i1:34-519(+)